MVMNLRMEWGINGYHLFLDETLLSGSFPADCFFLELRLQLRTSGDKPMIQSQPCQKSSSLTLQVALAR